MKGNSAIIHIIEIEFGSPCKRSVYADIVCLVVAGTESKQGRVVDKSAKNKLKILLKNSKLKKYRSLYADMECLVVARTESKQGRLVDKSANYKAKIFFESLKHF